MRVVLRGGEVIDDVRVELCALAQRIDAIKDSLPPEAEEYQLLLGLPASCWNMIEAASWAAKDLS